LKKKKTNKYLYMQSKILFLSFFPPTITTQKRESYRTTILVSRKICVTLQRAVVILHRITTKEVMVKFTARGARRRRRLLRRRRSILFFIKDFCAAG